MYSLANVFRALEEPKDHLGKRADEVLLVGRYVTYMKM